MRDAYEAAGEISDPEAQAQGDGYFAHSKGGGGHAQMAHMAHMHRGAGGQFVGGLSVAAGGGSGGALQREPRTSL